MKELKVEYTDDVEKSFEIKCAEIKAVQYKIYGKGKRNSYKLLATKLDKQKAIDYARNVNKDKYDTVLIIEHNEKENSDFPIFLEDR